jgi:hypothetical protein
MISSQDFERLSAYIDNQLSAKEKAALEELRQTVQALRSLPVVKPPRNFMLSAKQVRAEPRRQWFPVLRMATSLAGLVLALVFAGDFIFSRAPAMSPAAPLQYTTGARSAAVPTEAPPASAMPAAAAALPAPTEMMDQSAAGGNLGAGGATGSNAPTATLPEANTPMSAAVLAAPPVTTSATSAAPGAEQPTLAAVEPTALAKLAPTEEPPALPPAGTAAAAAQAPAPLAPTRGLAITESPAPLTPAEKSAAATARRNVDFRGSRGLCGANSGQRRCGGATIRAGPSPALARGRNRPDRFDRGVGGPHLADAPAVASHVRRLWAHPHTHNSGQTLVSG